MARTRLPLVSSPASQRLLPSLLQLSPLTPLLTRDQVLMLKRDVVVSPGAHDLKELGIEPTALELIVPTYLRRFRRTAWAA